MPNYRRPHVTGGAYFITQVTHQRHPWLCGDVARHALRTAISQVRQKRPFDLDAFVLLPDHFHCLMTLPTGDRDFPVKHQLCESPLDWPFSSVHRFVAEGHDW